jgi:hypothetical protein
MQNQLRQLALLARFKQALEPTLRNIAPGWEVQDLEVLANTRNQESEIRLVIRPADPMAISGS